MSTSNDYKMWWSNKEKIVRGFCKGTITKEIAKYILEDTNTMAKRHGPKVKWLIDLRQVKMVSPSAYMLLAKASAHPSISKYAFFGLSKMIEPVAKLITKAAQQKKYQFFSNESEALYWLEADEYSN